MTRVRRAACGMQWLMLLLVTAISASAQEARDSSDKHRRWLALPGFGWAPETGFEAGLTLVTVTTSKRDSTLRPTTMNAYAVRSVKGQTRAAFELDRWLPGNKQHMVASVAFVEYPTSFHGIGDNTAETDEERYLPRWFEVYLQASQRVWRSMYATGGIRAGYQEITPRTAGGLLDLNQVPGSHITRTVTLSGGLSYDTRDNIVSTRRGMSASVGYGLSAPVLGATYGFGRMHAEYKVFRELPKRQVIAAHALLLGSHGTVPFDQLYGVGGSRLMRGYGCCRFRDRWLAATQAEYRSPLVFERVGAVAFAGVGAVAPAPNRFGGARPFPSFGFGGRLVADKVQRSALRIDYGFGRYGFTGMYVGFNQAF